jgi:hypothetical protein
VKKETEKGNVIGCTVKQKQAKISLCLIRHHAMKKYGGAEV